MNLFFTLQKKNSGEIARNRLKLLLVSDKANCSSEIIEMIRDDMIRVISKYMEIDSDGMDIQITQIKTTGHQGTIPALYANIPIREIQPFYCHE